MKGLSSNVTKALEEKSTVKVDDNTGAKKLRVISVETQSTRRRRRAKLGVGEVFKGSVIQGNIDMKGEIVRGLLIRQKKEYKRSNGRRIQFEDNAAVIIDEIGEPQGTEIKGVIAKEAAERFPKVSTIAKNVV